jgi:hypothetical protein
MSNPNWDALTEQLRDDPDANVRRKACRQLMATRDPAVIPFLRNAYLQDEDEHVREAAQEALATFKAIKEGRTVRQFPISNRVLTILCGGLAGLFVISLVLHALGMILGGGDSDHPASTPRFLPGDKPSDRAALVTTLQDKLARVQELSASLRGEIKAYDASGQVKCPLTYALPESALLSGIDNYTYPDLKLVAENLDAARPSLERALVLLNSACADPATQTERVLQASAALDTADGQVNKASGMLQRAVTNPAPTVGPTVTPLPTWTFTPSPTSTVTPITPTAIPSATLPASETPVATMTMTPSITPSFTPTPVPTLPFPDFDYSAIESELSKRYRTVLGDLKNTYGTGMMDQWQKIIDGTPQQSTGSCGSLQVWPEAFALTGDQLAQLHGGTVADPDLEEAVRLQQEGLNYAVQARALFDRDCTAFALANSAQEGVALAQKAYDALTQSQYLYDLIRARP